jgi:hypothetical protein
MTRSSEAQMFPEDAGVYGMEGMWMYNGTFTIPLLIHRVMNVPERKLFQLGMYLPCKAGCVVANLIYNG